MKRRSVSTHFQVPPLLVSQHWANSYHNGTTQGNTEDLSSDRKSKSSLDIRNGEESPRISRKKKIWNSFKRFRSRSGDKSRKQRDHERRESDINESEADLSLSSVDCVSGKGINIGLDSELNPDRNERGDGSLMGSAERSDLNGNIKTTKKSGSKRSSKASLRKSNSQSEQRERDSEWDITDEYNDNTVVRQRHAALREHPFFQLEIHLKEGRDLAAMDSCGTSDPYVKLKLGNKQMYKSRIIYKSLNPVWNERFILPIDDPDKEIRVLVYDYDRGVSDDAMGTAEINLSSLDLNVPTDLKLNLIPGKGMSKKCDLGFILLECTLLPKTQEDKEQILSPGFVNYNIQGIFTHKN